MKLNLGAADRHIDGYLCVDIAPPPCAVCDAMYYEGCPDGHLVPWMRQLDLSQPTWTWTDNQIDEVLAYDVIEHLPDRIHTMNELHRILKPGGVAIIETPNAARGVGYFQDPTHCSPFCLSTFKYFENGSFANNRLRGAYGIRAQFEILSLTESRSNGEDPREEVWKIRAVLKAVK